MLLFLLHPRVMGISKLYSIPGRVHVSGLSSTACFDKTCSSRIVGIDLSTGYEIFSIGTILGKVAGAPVRSSDSRHLLVTHHASNARTSYFTVWDIQESRPVYAYDRLGSPFSPLGVYWNPVQGYYDDGFENTNDIFVWSLDLEEDSTDPSGGLVFVFQFPVDAEGPPRVVTVGDERQFRSPHAPVLANGGLNMYMAISRNDIRCWAGEQDLRRYAFHTGGIGRVDFPRSEVEFSAAPPAPPSVAEVTGAIYGPTATGEIFRLNANCSQNVTIPTNQVVQSKVLVGHEYVYYATQAPAAALYQLDPETLEATWQFPLDRGVVADMALSLDGKTIFLSDIAGLVRAISIAVPAAPTPAPPPTVPTVYPTEPPTAQPTKSPAPSSAPTTAIPTVSPQPTTDAPATAVVTPPNGEESSNSSRQSVEFLLSTLFVGLVCLI